MFERPSASHIAGLFTLGLIALTLAAATAIFGAWAVSHVVGDDSRVQGIAYAMCLPVLYLLFTLSVRSGDSGVRRVAHLAVPTAVRVMPRIALALAWLGAGIPTAMWVWLWLVPVATHGIP